MVRLTSVTSLVRARKVVADVIADIITDIAVDNANDGSRTVSIAIHRKRREVRFQRDRIFLT